MSEKIDIPRLIIDATSSRDEMSEEEVAKWMEHIENMRQHRVMIFDQTKYDPKPKMGWYTVFTVLGFAVGLSHQWWAAVGLFIPMGVAWILEENDE